MFRGRCTGERRTSPAPAAGPSARSLEARGTSSVLDDEAGLLDLAFGRGLPARLRRLARCRSRRDAGATRPRNTRRETEPQDLFGSVPSGAAPDRGAGQRGAYAVSSVPARIGETRHAGST